MNHITQLMDFGNEHLEQLRTEARLHTTVRECTSSTRFSIRRRIARLLRRIAHNLDRSELNFERA